MDKKEALKQIKAGNFSLEDVDDKLKADKEVVLEAIKQDGLQNSLYDVDDKLKGDKEFVLEVVKQNGWNLRHVDDKLKADKEVVLAVSYNDKKYDLIGNTQTQSVEMNLYKGK